MLKIQLRITEINYILQYIHTENVNILLNRNNFTISNFYCIFDQINPALVSTLVSNTLKSNKDFV